MNTLLAVVLLAEIHGGLVPEAFARLLFGQKIIDEFSVKYPVLAAVGGYLGKGSRKNACQRKKLSEMKFDLVCRIFRYLGIIPWIRFAAVSGSVSYDNAEESDDIDVMLIVAEHRLWLVRLLEQASLRLIGVRRIYGSHDVKNKVCINLYLSENCLDVSKFMRKNLHTALEIAALKPVCRGGYYEKFLRSNLWVQDYFPKLRIPEEGTSEISKRSAISSVLDIVDDLVMRAQLRYMKLFGHGPDLSVLSNERIQFFEKNAWRVSDVKLETLLQRYDIR